MTDAAPARRSRGDVAVACRHLIRLYESTTGSVSAIRGVDLDIEAGLITAVRGPSGSGKTTFLRLIAGLDRPSAGSVTVAGVDLNSLSAGARAKARARLLTHVHQRPIDNLFPHLTAVQQLARLADGPDDADAALAEVELESVASHRPSQMSGGERQRLAVALAIVARHPVLIADEPTAQLDDDAADATLDALWALRERGTAVIVATHDPRVVDRVDQVVLLRDGAVSSVTAAGTELAVIDGSGRVQLPPEARQAFDEGRARITFDPDTGQVRLDRP